MPLTIGADSEKKKYFKIQTSNTAPATAPYSSENVKRRKVQDRESREVTLRLARRRRYVRKSKLLEAPLSGAFLAREYGQGQSDMAARIFARSLNKTILDLDDVNSERDRNSAITFFVDPKLERSAPAVNVYMCKSRNSFAQDSVEHLPFILLDFRC